MNAGRFCNHRLTRNHTCCALANDECQRIPRYSSGFAEIVYAQTLAKHTREQCGPAGDGSSSAASTSAFEPHFIIDTGRAGNGNARTPERCHDWCNLNSAGAGPIPTITSPLPALVDAFFWVKFPGESDGCSELLPDGSVCERYDAGCGRASALGGSVSSSEDEAGKDGVESNDGDSPMRGGGGGGGGVTAAPEAGQWFGAFALSLARHAELRFSGGVSRGAIRGERVPSAEEEAAERQRLGLPSGGLIEFGGFSSGGSVSSLVELWRPSPRCVLLLIGVGVFSCICACGLSLAFVATWKGGGGGGDGGGGGPSSPPPPRHRTLASHFHVKYLCEPRLGLPRGGADQGGGQGSGSYGAVGWEEGEEVGDGDDLTGVGPLPLPLAADNNEEECRMDASEPMAAAAAGRRPFVSSLEPSSGSELETRQLVPPSSPAGICEPSGNSIPRGRRLNVACTLAASVRSHDAATALNVLSDLESASDREESMLSGVMARRGMS